LARPTSAPAATIDDKDGMPDNWGKGARIKSTITLMLLLAKLHLNATNIEVYINSLVTGYQEI